MMNRLTVLIFLVALTGTSNGEEIVLPDPSTALSPTPDESGMQGGYEYGVGWYNVVPLGFGKSAAPGLELRADLNIGTVKRGAYGFGVCRTIKAQDYVWFGDGYRRVLEINLPGEVNERGLVKLETMSNKVDGLPNLSGALLPVRSEKLPAHTGNQYANLWSVVAFVKELRTINGEDELEAEIGLLNQLIFPIRYDRPDRIIVVRKGDVIELPAKAATGRATAKIRCAGIYREIADKGFSGGVDLVPVDFTFYKDKR